MDLSPASPRDHQTKKQDGNHDELVETASPEAEMKVESSQKEKNATKEKKDKSGKKEKKDDIAKEVAADAEARALFSTARSALACGTSQEAIDDNNLGDNDETPSPKKVQGVESSPTYKKAKKDQKDKSAKKDKKPSSGDQAAGSSQEVAKQASSEGADAFSVRCTHVAEAMQDEGSAVSGASQPMNSGERENEMAKVLIREREAVLAPTLEEATYSLRYYAANYAKRFRKGQRPSALGPYPSPTDADELMKAFEKDVAENGFLTPDCVLAEMELACSARRWGQGKLLNTQEDVGTLLKGLLKMLYTLEVTLDVAFVAKPVMTLRDLETAILKMPAFKQLQTFAEAGLGNLHCHPEVARRFQFSDSPPMQIPTKWPDISTSDVLSAFMKGLPSGGRRLWDREGPDAWTLEKALDKLAAKWQVSSFRELGVYIQRDLLVDSVLRRLKERQIQRESFQRETNATVDRELGRIQGATSTINVDWATWTQTLQAFANLPPNQQLLFAQRLTADQLGALRFEDNEDKLGHSGQEEGGESRKATPSRQADAFVQTFLAPLLMATFRLAHGDKDRGRGTAAMKRQHQVRLPHLGQVAAAYQKLLVATKASVYRGEYDDNVDLVSLDTDVHQVLTPVLRQLRSFPAAEPCLATVLMRAEKALQVVCEVDDLADMPLSLPQLLSVDSGLRAALQAVVAGASGFVAESARGPEAAGRRAEGGNLADHLAELAKADLEARGDLALHDSEHVQPRDVSFDYGDILAAIGRAERALCRAHGVKAFGDLDSDTESFGTFLSTHGTHILEALGVSWTGSGGGKDVAGSAAGSHAVHMCLQLMQQLACPASEATVRLQRHYGNLLPRAEALSVAHRTAKYLEAGSHAEDYSVAFAPPRTLQTLLARSGWDETGGEGLEHAESDDMEAIVAGAVKALLAVPPLVDLHESLDTTWEAKFEPSLGPLSEFIMSEQLSLALASSGSKAAQVAREYGVPFNDALPPLQVVEVRAGTYVRLSDGSKTSLDAALDAADGRAAAATVLARLLADGPKAPRQQFEAAIALWLQQHSASDELATLRGMPGICEYFLLDAIASLPREARGAAGPILTKPYLHLRRDRKLLAAAAAGTPSHAAVARWLGRHCGILEWQQLEDKTHFASASIASFAPARGRDAVEDTQRSVSAAVNGKGAEVNESLPQRREVAREEQSNSAAAPKASREAAEGADPPREATAEGAAVTEDTGSINEVLCRDIARLKAVDLADVDPFTRFWKGSRNVDPTLRSLQQTVQGAVKRLAADLYSTETHFLLELLQNVDDCQFRAGEQPWLRMTLEMQEERFAELTTLVGRTAHGRDLKALLALEYNETGFEERNVRALCDIAQSTKSIGDRKFIGAKGIGFKSVFRITSIPTVHSGPYHFQFDAQALDGLGYLIPFPLPPAPGFESASAPGAASGTGAGTRLVLPLDSAKRLLEVRTHILQDVQPTLLLFLRKLRAIEVVADNAGRCRRAMSKSVAGRVVTLRTVACVSSEDTEADDVKEERWLVYPHQAKVLGRDGIEQAELQLAFRIADPPPVDEESEDGANEHGAARGPVAAPPPLQQAFAWLPLRSYGFRFIIQADWVVPSSREAITETDPFNQSLREELPAAFANASVQLLERALGMLPGLEISRSAEKALFSEQHVEGAPEDETESADGEEAAEQPEPQKVSCPAPSTPSNAAIGCARALLSQLYGVVPLPGEASEFFAASPKAILSQLREVPVLLARRRQEGGGCSLLLARPSESVRAEFPTRVPEPWGDRHLVLLEPLLNSAGRYFEVGHAPRPLLEALHVPALDGHVAVECLEQVARKFAAAGGTRPPTKLEMDQVHLLLLILASGELPPALLHRLGRLKVVPTDDGQLQAVAAHAVYHVGAEFSGVVPATRSLSVGFAAMMHQKVATLLYRLGVERADGPRFFRQMLVPVLIGPDRPQVSHLVRCTAAARRFLDSQSERQQRDALLAVLHTGSGLWVALQQMPQITEGTRQPLQPEVVFWDRSGALHLQMPPLPCLWACSKMWLCVSEAYLSPECLGPLPPHAAAPRPPGPTGDAAERQSWGRFWLECGAWPAMAVESPSDDAMDWDSADLRQFLQSIEVEPSAEAQANMSQALMAWLGPQGDFYAKFMVTKREPGPQGYALSRMGEQLRSRPWLVTRRGNVVSAADTWFACANDRLPDLVAAYALVQLSSVDILIKLWPQLKLSNAPSIGNLVRIVRDVSLTVPAHRSVHEMLCLYAAIWESLQRDPSALSEHDRTFLRTGSWVFVPDHPRLIDGRRRRFDDRGVLVPLDGAFLPPTRLVFKDEAKVVDSYMRQMPDQAIDMAREGSGIRVVGQYYWGKYTLFPPGMPGVSWTPKHEHSQMLFEWAGARRTMEVGDYVRVLEGVACHANVMPDDPIVFLMWCVLDQVLPQVVAEIDADLRQAVGGEEFDEPEATVENADEEVSGHRAETSQKADPCVERALERLKPEHANCKKLRQFIKGTAHLKWVPTRAGTWEELWRVELVDGKDMPIEWTHRDALRLIATGSSSAYDAEQMRRAWVLCGLSERPQLALRALVSAWQRGRESAAAATVLLAAARWACNDIIAREAAADGGGLPSSVQGLGDFAWLLLECCRRIDFLEAVTGAESGGRPIQLQQVVAVSRHGTDSPDIAELPSPEGSLLLWRDGAVRSSVTWRMTNEAIAVTCFVGFVAAGTLSPQLQEELREDAVVAAFSEPAVEALSMNSELARHVVDQVVNQAVSEAIVQQGIEAGGAAVHGLRLRQSETELNRLKRELLKRLQAVSSLLEEARGHRPAELPLLEAAAADAERAARLAGYDGGGSARDLLPDRHVHVAEKEASRAEAESSRVDDEAALRRERRKRWAEAAASVARAEAASRFAEAERRAVAEAQAEESAKAGSGSEDEDEGGHKHSLLDAATAALGPKRELAADKPKPQSLFGAAIPCGPAPAQKEALEVAPPPDLDEDQAQAASSAMGARGLFGSGAAKEAEGGEHEDGGHVFGVGGGPGATNGTGAGAGGGVAQRALFGGGGVWESSLEQVEARLRATLSEFIPPAADPEPGEPLQEVILDSAARLDLAELRQLPSEEVSRILGRAGEEVAARALRKKGFEVAWVNTKHETAWPFDLLVRPRLPDGKEEWPAPLDKLLRAAAGGEVPPTVTELEAALAGVQGAAVIEVKACFGRVRPDVFDISSTQLQTAHRLRSRYWLAIVGGLGDGKAQVQFIENLDLACRKGRVNLLMIA